MSNNPPPVSLGSMMNELNRKAVVASLLKRDGDLEKLGKMQNDLTPFRMQLQAVLREDEEKSARGDPCMTGLERSGHTKLLEAANRLAALIAAPMPPTQ